MNENDIRHNAILVTQELRTDYIAKKHGGYDIYQDDRLRIVVDTYVPNIGICLVDRGQRVCVFSTAYHSAPTIYRPGHWEEYLADLSKQAHLKRTQRKAVIQAEEELEHGRRFGPIDDSAIFASRRE